MTLTTTYFFLIGNDNNSSWWMTTLSVKQAHWITRLIIPLSGPQYQLNSLWPSDSIWRHGSGSTLVQVMACCLMAPSHYLNQCWLLKREVRWHSPESYFAQATTLYNEFENYTFEITATAPNSQWVNPLCAEFCSGNMKIYLHFLELLYTQMMLSTEIHTEQGFNYPGWWLTLDVRDRVILV